MKKLHLEFLDNTGKRRTLVLKRFAPDLSPAVIESEMEKLIALKVFTKYGTPALVKAIGAYYREVDKDVIYSRKEG